MNRLANFICVGFRKYHRVQWCVLSVEATTLACRYQTACALVISTHCTHRLPSSNMQWIQQCLQGVCASEKRLSTLSSQVAPTMQGFGSRALASLTRVERITASGDVHQTSCHEVTNTMCGKIMTHTYCSAAISSTSAVHPVNGLENCPLPLTSS